MYLRPSLFVLGLLSASLTIAGCSKPAPPPAATVETTDAAHDSHDGWWCGPHGVPEEVCTRCNASLIAEFKAKGDWCAEHDLPDSQCFVCHPEKEAEFASLYEAKTGKPLPKN